MPRPKKETKEEILTEEEIEKRINETILDQDEETKEETFEDIDGTFAIYDIPTNTFKYIREEEFDRYNHKRV